MKPLHALWRWWQHLPGAQRILGALGIALGLLLLTPTRPAAACGFSDGSCMVDQGMYNAMLIVARLLWTANRLLLLVAYLLDVIRFEIVENLFLGPYTQLTALVGEAVVPMASLAITLAMLAILLAPLTGMASPFNIRQIMVIVLIAPVLLLSLGTALGDMDKLRVDLADQLYAASASGGASFVDGVSASAGDMAAPSFLYPTTCPAGPAGGPAALLPRHTGGLDGERVLRPDELAASYLYASAADIHCDYAADAQVAGLPAQWANEGSPGYVHAGDIGDQEAAPRAVWNEQLNAGIIRLFLGLFVSTLALVYYAAHLVFTLALVALWVSIPIGLLFGMFKQDFGWAGEYVKSAFETLKNSWVTSFIIGLLTAGLIAAAQSGNANVFAGIASATLVFLVFTFFNALATLKGALSALSSVVGGAMGGGANLLSGAAGMVGTAALGAATGGASMALGAAGGVARGAGELGRMGQIANAATRESGSRTYGMAAALGRSNSLMRAGEFARSVGVMRGPGGDAALDAMRAGNASHQGVKVFNQRLRGSAKTGATLEQARAERTSQAKAASDAQQQQRADSTAQARQQRQLAQLDQLRAGNVAQRGVSAARALPGALGAGVATARGAAAIVRQRVGATAEEPALAALAAASAGGAAIGAGVRRGIGRSRAGISAGTAAAARAARQTAQAARRSVDPNDRFAAAWRMDAQGRYARVDDPAEAAPPAGARRSDFSNAELHGAMRDGATVRFHADRTASVWGGGQTPATDTADAPRADAAAPAPPAAANYPQLTPAELAAPQPVPDATLAAMQANRPARQPRPPRGRRKPSTTSPGRSSDDDPSTHLGD